MVYSIICLRIPNANILVKTGRNSYGCTVIVLLSNLRNLTSALCTYKNSLFKYLSNFISVFECQKQLKLQGISTVVIRLPRAAIQIHQEGFDLSNTYLSVSYHFSCSSFTFCFNDQGNNRTIRTSFKTSDLVPELLSMLRKSVENSC